MSTEVQIFLRPLQDCGMAALLAEVSRLAGVALTSGPDIYEGRAHVGILDDDIAIELFADTSELDDDGDMPFTSHPYMLEFRPLRGAIEIAKAQESMDRIYDKLKETGRYSMFSTFDVQYVIRRDVV